MNSHASNRAEEGREASQLHHVAAAQNAKIPSLRSAKAGSKECGDTGGMKRHGRYIGYSNHNLKLRAA